MKPASFEEREWIDPWRDRYPMTDDPVLVTYFFGGKLRVDTARYRKGNELSSPIALIEVTEGWCCAGTVLAWQPLPEAYDPVAETE